MSQRGSSRERYRGVRPDSTSAINWTIRPSRRTPAPSPGGPSRGKRREYLREYLRWLWPHRYAVGTVFALALLGAGLEMVEPLFMRFIIDRVLLNTALDTAVAPAPAATWPAPRSSA